MISARFPVLRSCLVCRTVMCLAFFGLCLVLPCPARSQTATKPLMVFAAVSLKTALDEIGKDWSAQGHAPVVMTYAASSTLAQQILAGAPVDLFIAADLDWMDWLSARGAIRSDQRQIIAGNRLALITHQDNPASLSFDDPRSLLAALGQGRLALADPRSVPAGKYGKAALDALGIWGQLADRIIPADHVRAVVTFVARKEAPLGIVYLSDVRADPALKLVALFPQATHQPILYPAAVIAQTKQAEAAAFLAFLTSPSAQSRLTAQGFLPAPLSQAGR